MIQVKKGQWDIQALIMLLRTPLTHWTCSHKQILTKLKQNCET